MGPPCLCVCGNLGTLAFLTLDVGPKEKEVQKFNCLTSGPSVVSSACTPNPCGPIKETLWVMVWNPTLVLILPIFSSHFPQLLICFPWEHSGNKVLACQLLPQGLLLGTTLSHLFLSTFPELYRKERGVCGGPWKYRTACIIYGDFLLHLGFCNWVAWK
jgi:hypothetical protein